MAEKDEKLIGITPAMREGSGLVRFSEKFPERYFDVGIAEKHAMTFAAGAACGGLKPVVAIYSTFLQRAYDQLIHDVSVQGLDVTLAIDSAGIVGADGPTHQGAFDLTFLRCLPNMVVMAPADEAECRDMLYTAYRHQGPAAVRYPRGAGPGKPENKIMNQLPLGCAQTIRTGKRIAILAFGTMVLPALEAADSLDATVVNMRFVKPLDESLILDVARSHDMLITIEENTVLGGAGSGVAEILRSKQFTIPMLSLGLPDHHVEHGSPNDMLADCGLDSAGILRAIKQAVQSQLAPILESA
jgi:1-deoxy-D-xylulose-5-phosphate synthase